MRPVTFGTIELGVPFPTCLSSLIMVEQYSLLPSWLCGVCKKINTVFIKIIVQNLFFLCIYSCFVLGVLEETRSLSTISLGHSRIWRSWGKRTSRIHSENQEKNQELLRRRGEEVQSLQPCVGARRIYSTCPSSDWKVVSCFQCLPHTCCSCHWHCHSSPGVPPGSVLYLLQRIA